MIFERISDDIPPQMKILNMVNPILMHFCSLFSNGSVASCIKAPSHPTKCDVIIDLKLFSTVYGRINCCKFLTLSNQTSRYKSKCIIMLDDCHTWSVTIYRAQSRIYLVFSYILSPVFLQ